MAAELDLKDRKILFELDLNARASAAKIAKKVKLSKESVNYRINKMLRGGIIKSFYTVVDVGRLGFVSFRMYLRLHNTTMEKEKELIGFLVENPSVGWVVSCDGNWDINFVYWSRGIFDFKDFLDRFFEKYRNCLENKIVAIFTKIWHFKKAYLLEEKVDRFEPDVIGARETVEVDGLDVKILQVISHNARMPLMELAQKLKVSDKVIAYRIKCLEKEKVIKGYRVQLDLDKLGYLYYKIHLKFQNISDKRLRELEGYCRAHPNVIYIDEFIGGADYEIEVQVKSSQHFHEFLGELRSKFADIIEDYESLLYYKEYKLIFFPSKF